MIQPRSRRRLLIGIAIVSLWIGTWALLWRHEAPPAPSPVPLETPAGEREILLAVLLGDETRVGTIHLRSHAEQRDGRSGERSELDATITLRLLGEPTDLSIRGSSWRASEPPALEVDFSIESSGQQLAVTAEMKGGKIVGELDSGGETTPLELPLGSGDLISGGFGGTLALPRLEPGERARIATFDPMTLSPGSSTVRCVARETLRYDGREVEALRLEVESAGMILDAWTDPEGQILRAETPFGFTLQRLEDEATASSSESVPASGEDLLALTAVHPLGPTPFRGAASLDLRITGAPTDLPTDETQQDRGEGRFRIAPIGPESQPPHTSATPVPEDLAADALVQSDHPLIRETAATITAGATGPYEKARRIHDWVFEEVEKLPAMSVPSALAVLEARRGDCNEHTVLFTALARAAGLPTRIAIGLVWSETWDGFYYHAWPRVHLGDRWIWMDPTLGQPVADATHLLLLEGGIEQWPRLLRWLGKIEIEIEALPSPEE